MSKRKHNKADGYPARVVLGEGQVYIPGPVSVCVVDDDGAPVRLAFPESMTDASEGKGDRGPRYRLVLERVEPEGKR